VIVRVLGSAAGGGVPQWNCACANCRAARDGRAPRRTQSSFAISATGERWWLVNCSPDIAQQIEATPELQPRAGRGTPIAGMLFTDANVDHMGGLAVLRQSGEHAFELFSTDVVRSLATAQRAFSPFAEPPHAWHAIAPGECFALDGLAIAVVSIGGATPGYDGRKAHPEAVVAFEIQNATRERSALLAPIYPEISPALREAAGRASIAFLDGSFWSDDELAGVDVPKSARSLGHLPIGGPQGTLAVLGTASAGSRRFFAHLNNTNPALDPHSPERAALERAGAELAADGVTLAL
jgi:pyrroloquinoline quinone biosynthesis protein B